MKVSSSLLIVFCGLTTALVKEHVYVKIPKNWIDAQSYCRQNYEDLSTIQSEEEQIMLKELAGVNFTYSWIGLYRSETNINNFLWSNGDSFSFSKWAPGQPNNLFGNQFCVYTEVNWHDFQCNYSYPFFCQKKSFILVKMNKTWEEALEYCRAHHINLASMTSEIQLQLTKNENAESQTDSVWTGLRFLTGEWLWVNREPLGNQATLPECPAEPFRCGARNSKTDKWENRDCDEKLNFLCN